MSENTNTSLNLNTIQNAINIIGVCCQRGAFRPEEMENVGKTYNQMKTFIKAAEVAVAAEAGEAEAGAAGEAGVPEKVV
tara:strand:- start:3252 stop:3488 length:237 start_codon:yes stop_codon:yes gene_type:complete